MLTNADLLTHARHQAATFQTILNKRDYLFAATHYIEVAEPVLSRKKIGCNVFIPAHQDQLPLVDGLGTISGSLLYDIHDEQITLSRYSFKFEHAFTYIQFFEDEALDKLRYSFHYDFDRDATKAIVHPAHHIQISSLSVPRFETKVLDSEVAIFKNFLSVVEKTFYNNSSPEGSRPKLDCKDMYLTQYQ